MAHSQPVGVWDSDIAWAIRFGWTPEQVGRMDPDFLTELTARLNAAADLEREKEEKPARRRR